MFEFDSRVRYSEVDSDCELRWGALVNYLQDCSTFHSEDLGVGVRYLLEKGMAWVLNYWQIDLIRMPKLADRITIGTIPYEIKGCLGLRNFYIRDTLTGEMLVKANSVWTLIDLDKVRPVKADTKMLEGYTIGEKLDMEYTDRKIAIMGEGINEAPIEISVRMLDSNQHVNNEQYIEMALGLVPKGSKIARVRTEYKKSAYLGDVLVPTVFRSADTLDVVFTRTGDSEPCVKCQFLLGNA